jgi:hypothetical protein
MLKDPSAMLGGETALLEDKVPHTEEEITVLRRVKARNGLIHGRARQAPSRVDLRYATAIVARMLVYRVNKLAGESGISGLGDLGLQ